MNNWKQKKFYISTFKALPHSTTATLEDFRRVVRIYKEAGFNLIENAIMSRAEGLQAAEACELEEMPFLIQNITGDKGFSGMGSKCPPVTEELAKELVEEQKDKKFLEGYFLWDEPVTVENFHTLRQIQDDFEKFDSNGLMYSLLLPSYGPLAWDPNNVENSEYKKYVDDFMAIVQPPILSFDYYPLMKKTDNLIVNNLWADVGYFRKKALEAGVPFWFYFQSANMGEEKPFTHEMRSAQAYAVLAYGVKCLSYFASGGCVCNGMGEPADCLAQVTDLNRRIQHIGDYLFEKESMAVYHYGIDASLRGLYCLDDETASDLILSAPDKTLAGVFQSADGEICILLVNKDLGEDCHGTLCLKDARIHGVFDAENGEMNPVNEGENIQVDIPAGSCLLLSVKKN